MEPVPMFFLDPAGRPIPLAPDSERCLLLQKLEDLEAFERQHGKAERGSPMENTRNLAKRRLLFIERLLERG